MDTREVVYAIGRKKLVASLDVGETAISEAIVRGHFPSGWYPTIKSLAEKEGLEVSLSLFNWRVPVKDNHTAA